MTKYVVMIRQSYGWAYLGRGNKLVDSKFQARTWTKLENAHKAAESLDYLHVMVSEK